LPKIPPISEAVAITSVTFHGCGPFDAGLFNPGAAYSPGSFWAGVSPFLEPIVGAASSGEQPRIVGLASQMYLLMAARYAFTSRWT
jgi:hypothetical protein